jgi:hypothetical protein
MANRSTKQESHSWAVYHIKGTPAKLVGMVHDRPNAESASKQAIEEYKVAPNECGRLMAQRRDWDRQSSLGCRQFSWFGQLPIGASQ